MYFGLRNTVIWFFAPKTNLKNFRFLDLEKFQIFFKKFVKFFSIFILNFSIFYTFCTNFYNFHQLLTHLELY